MAVEDILNRIKADAEEEAQRLLADGREEAGAILAEAKAKADAQRKDLRTRAEQHAAEERNRITTLARLSVRRELLDAKQALIDRVFNEAGTRIEKLSRDEYRTFIGGLLEEYVESGDEEVLIGEGETRIDQPFLDSVGAKIGRGKGLRLSDERRRIRGGFILRSGRVETNCVLETILRDAREKLETEIASVLFGDGGTRE
ncbi:MAG: V-type ATP synthase subunit E [Candidatus Eisenbacteria bacterium]|nr:V-type ATP synthase subunit E [Candidatus Eisenbacteria bacterium]